MEQARAHGDTVVASIFVNRLQFGPNEDFDKYPRTFTADCDKLAAAGVDVLFAPTESDLYPEPQEYTVEPPAIQHQLDGEFRPGHFRGVATVVLKLFNIVQPQAALFGKKDYQQLMVIRNMTRQLALPIDIIGGETMRRRRRPRPLVAQRLSERNRTCGSAAPLSRTAADNRCHPATAKPISVRLENAAISVLTAAGRKTDYVAVRQQSDWPFRKAPAFRW